MENYGKGLMEKMEKVEKILIKEMEVKTSILEVTIYARKISVKYYFVLGMFKQIVHKLINTRQVSLNLCFRSFLDSITSKI